MKKLIALGLLALVLAGCKAQEVEVRVSTAQLQKALAGDAETVRFIARFENFGKLDESERTKLDMIQSIVEKELEVDDYNLVSDTSKVTITVEGELPIFVGQPGEADETFALYVWPVDNALLPNFSHVMTLGTGKRFEAMQAKMQAVSYMLAIDAVQPVMYRLKADSDVDIPLLAGGGQIDGGSFVLKAESLKDGDRVNLTFKGGAYDTAFGGMMLGLPASQ